LLVQDNASDVARAASTVERPSLLAHVPVLCVDGFEVAANTARLPPRTVAKVAPAMDALMGCGVKEREVFDAVVLLVLIDVVDLESNRHGSVSALPFDNVSEP
jgi:hypothetical protein